ncbi:polyamine aminopropyltransferase [Intestinibacter sp.]|uniref:polyamine aminopropyltransferase n=1 Tax=Intestinibacter sp. TaxID=1965304 RepID=UPI002A765560|nr:polyamine aminopropyltransferase [Intestinibacter sp.]MDY2738072.1 polyamine aminopropyltransferase [Intestinibacter sp.]
MEEKNFNYKILMLTTLIISGCSIIYEVLISAISSYLIGDSIKQFSITIGLYMFAMGMGSYISKYIKDKLFDWLIRVELSVGIFGGLSSVILFSANAYLSSYTIVMLFLIVIIGILVGLEIPLLTRIMEENKSNLSVTLSNIFSFDYIGGLVGSIVFPLLLLPQLGYFTTSFLVGSVNILVAILILLSYKEYIFNYEKFKYIMAVFLTIMVLGTFFSEDLSKTIEDKMYRDKVIYSKQTEYQRIVMTKYKDDVRLFLDGNIQFGSRDEYRYHEALVHIPISLAKNKENILILGGGDGLAAREVLKYDEVKNITLVDLDKDMVELCKTNNHIVALNEGSLSNKKLHVINNDAFKYLENSSKLYDVIIVDLPDPNNETLNKLYTNLFYRLCYRNLNEDGAMVVQSTSPYSAPKAFWCIEKTIESEGFDVYPYHLQVPSFGDWGFNLAIKSSSNDIKKEDIYKSIDFGNIELKYLNEDVLPGMFSFSEDEKADTSELDVNSLSNPKLIEYYQKAVEEWD